MTHHKGEFFVMSPSNTRLFRSSIKRFASNHPSQLCLLGYNPYNTQVELLSETPPFAMSQRTALGSLIKSIGNNGQGKVVPGWGPTPVMLFVGTLFVLFLVIMLQVYNQSILFQGFTVDWNGVG